MKRIQILELMKAEDPRIPTAVAANLESALVAALLLVRSPTFSDIELFLTITGLSYHGIFHLSVASAIHLAF